MFSSDESPYLERAEMHEQLAATTDDLPARKMHLAMAAEYRRKARELSMDAVHSADRSLKLDAAVL